MQGHIHMFKGRLILSVVELQIKMSVESIVHFPV